MPNEFYKAAVKGLGALVAPQAARRLVDEALRASNRTAEDVSESAMRRLLLTRVKRELAGVLPDHVLMPSLERVAAELAMADAAPHRRGLFGRRRAGPAGDAAGGRRAAWREPRVGFRDDAPEEGGTSAEGDADPFDSDELKGHAFGAEARDADTLNREVKKSSVYLPAVDLPAALAVAPARTVPQPGQVADRVHDVSTGATAGSEAVAGSTSAGLSVPAGMVERVIRTFADLETVRQIVVVNGMSVTQVRGEGLETDRLAALTVATKGLLNRAGGLRVFSLELPEGVLFLFPTSDGAIVVLTHPKVNIGAVLAARSDLEEAA